MFREKGEVPTINKILVSMLAIICVFAVAIILLVQLNKKNVETYIKETQGIIQNYTANEKNILDISEKGDGRVIATLAEDGTLTISGSGKMKDFSYSKSIKDLLNSTEIKKVVIEEGVTNIGATAFHDCSDLIDVKVPSTVTEIRHSAFSNCTSLTNINISEGLVSIGDCAFLDCRKLISITIPSTVINIGSRAFEFCESLESIEIPSGVVRIGDKAFYNSNSLKEIKVDENNAEYMDDNGVLYTKDKTTIIKYPEGKENIEYTILDGVTSIGDNAFKECTSIIKIKIPNGVVKIGKDAFESCISLIEINIPEGLTSICDNAFYGCISLIEINISEGVTNIDDNVFYGCSSLKEIHISSSVTSIGNDVFYKCSSLKKIDVDENNTKYMDDNGVLYTKNKTEIIKYPVKRGEKEYTILEGVTSIGDYAFYECTNIIKINVPNGVTKIGNYAFSNCTSLTGINIPEELISIGECGFSYCKSLINMNIPSSITNIGKNAFNGCELLIIIKNGTESLPDILKRVQTEGDILYSALEMKLTNCVIENGEIILSDKSKIGRIEVVNGNLKGLKYNILFNRIDVSENEDESVIASLDENGVLTISGNGDMKKASNQVPWYGIERRIKKLKISEDVTNVEKDVLKYCSNLEEVNVDENNIIYMDVDGVLYTKDKTKIVKYPAKKEDEEYTIIEGVKIIEEDAFYYCINLKSINIPEGVQTINKEAFAYCKELTSIEIPSSVKWIRARAFYDCSSLKNINISEELTTIDTEAFAYCRSLTIINMPSSITSIGDNVFYYCENLTSIEIPNNVTNIGDYAFWGCGSLIDISISSSVTNIGDAAFGNCSKLTMIKVSESNIIYMDINGVLYTKDKSKIVRYPEAKKDKEYTILESITSIEDYAFYGCNSLIKINIPKRVSNIGYESFFGCSSLTELNISERVTSIGDLAFYECSSLTDIKIPSSITSIGYRTFYNCENLTKIIIPADVTNIEDEVFSGCKKLTIWCHSDSVAETYAIKNNIKYQKIYLSSTEQEIDELNLLIKGIQPNTTVEELKETIQSEMSYEIINSEGNILTDVDIVATKYELKLENGTLYKLIVYGDTSGDGKAELKDILGINKHRLNKVQLVDEYLLAGDVNEDEKADIKDILQINKYRLGKISEL